MGAGTQSEAQIQKSGQIPQMELIDEQLIFASEKVTAFCADESKFFLRNLETVQGDEMDRIILSLTYGKSANGIFNASVLGPLNKSGGERHSMWPSPVLVVA